MITQEQQSLKQDLENLVYSTQIPQNQKIFHNF